MGLGTKFDFSSVETKSKTPETRFNLSELGAQITDLKARKTGDKTDLAQLGSFNVKDGALDLGKRSITLGAVELNKSQLNILRDRSGKLNVAQLLRPSSTAAPTKATEPASKTPEIPWQYAINKIIIDDSALRLQDSALPNRVADLRLDRIQLQADGLSSANKPIKLAFKAQFERTGRINLEGQVNPQTQAVDLHLDARELPILPLQPYFADQVQLTVTSGHISARGKLQGTFGAKPVVRYQGIAQVQQFASVDQLNKNDFLKWDDFSFSGVQVVSAPLNINIEEVSLNKFFSRLIVNPDGTLNVQHIVGDSATAAAGESTKTPPTEAKKPTPTAQAQAELPIKIGRVTLKEGKVNFSDRFIKPNYSANLTSIGGEITGLSAASTANIALRGQVDDAAPLDIQGKVKPFSGNLFLDVAASVKGLDLPSTTPHSTRYAGYPIIKGKLSMDVKYHIENQKLTAENRVVLDQLTFGERVESPDATKLPVLLAVALLRDRNGVIDINLPVSGSLNDPNFSIGGIIGRVIVNLLGKSLTSPFALLGSLFPNSEELSYIEFEAGSASLDSTANTKIENLAQALDKRPALKLDITGRVDMQSDKEALRRLSMERKLKKIKLDGLNQQRKSTTQLEDIQFAPGEYPILLKEAYSREKFTKPRNQLGFAKALPVAEMEQLMLDNSKIGDSELRQLALRRARVVTDVFVKTGKVNNARVFVLEPKLNTEPKEKLKNSRIDFSLK